MGSDYFTLSFPMFRKKVMVDIYCGSVRPIFEDVTAESTFYQNIRAGQRLDYRKSNVWKRVFVTSVSSSALELKACDNGEHISCDATEIRARCLPIDTVSCIVPYSISLYANRHTECPKK